MKTAPFSIPDGLSELRSELPLVVEIIARSACWVHPEAFHALPVWYPETARGRLAYRADWKSAYKTKNRVTSDVSIDRETNIRAGHAFMGALGAKKTPNWTICHIWSVDDPKFSKSNTVVQDPRYYSCVGNMVWLPTPLKGFTDSMPEIKLMLRHCAHNLYGWVCQHDDVEDVAREVRESQAPAYYPSQWPTYNRKCLPPRTAPFSTRVQASIDRRKKAICRMLDDQSLENYPREEVRRVLDFWKISLP